MINVCERHEGADYFIFDENHQETFTPSLFSPAFLSEHNCLVSTNMQGRGSAWAFHWQDQNYVLRHYRRGGLPAKVNKDQYLWSGLQNTRAWREWHLLATASAWQLPCPQPFAAHVRHSGLMYQADLITLHLPGTQTLAERLIADSLPRPLWHKVGATIRRFHDHQIFHADLNANNILIDEADRVFLIDFDRGTLRKGRYWKQQNLSRLHRSLQKVWPASSRKNPPPPWTALLEGYAHT